MKALIISFSSLGRTKKAAEIIEGSLSNYEVEHFSIKQEGFFFKKVKRLMKHDKGDFSSISSELEKLENININPDLFVIGMPTYGDKPPAALKEIVKKIDLEGKKVAMYTTCLGEGVNTLKEMETIIENAGATILKQTRFRKVSKTIDEVKKFGKEINQLELI